MKKEKEEVFVLEMPLQVERYQADILNKRYEQLRQLYNYVQGKLLKQYRYFEQMDEYRACKTFADKKTFFKAHPFYINGVLAKNGDLLAIKFEENSIQGYVEKLAQKQVGAGVKYADMGITTCILSGLSASIWSAWDKKLYDVRAKHISFKKYGELNSFSSRKKVTNGKVYFSGMELYLDSMELAVKLNSKTGQQAKFVKMPILHNPQHADYEMYALKGGLDSIKVVKVVRRLVRGQYKYYLQLSIGGKAPAKGRELGKGKVGLDLGPSTIAVAAPNRVSIDKLASKCDSIQEQLTRLSRKMDRSRRASNPQNFNEDGTIKRGIRLVWSQSNRYKALKDELTELHRRQAAVRRQQHIEMANALLKEGDTFIVENNPVKAWQRKAKETTKDEKTGKIKKKKRFGKSIHNHAPATFVTLLENKVKSLGGEFYSVDTRNAASRFDFTIGDTPEMDLGVRVKTLSNGDKHQRDMMSAFNLQHIDPKSKELKHYIVEDMNADYQRFCALEKEELDRYMRKEKKDDPSTIGAFRYFKESKRS